MARSPRTRLRLSMALMLAAVACTGGGPEDPKDQLIDALRTMRGDGGTVVDLSVSTDEATLQALQADVDGPLPPEAAQMLRTASLRVSMPLSPDGANGAVALRVGDLDLLEVRTVDKVVYARADVPKLLEALGQDPAMADGFRQVLASGGMLPADAIDGRWLKLNGAEQAMDAFTGGMGEAAPPELDQAKLQAAGVRLAGVIADASSVERVGADGDGEHLRATVPLREAYAAIMAEVDALGLPDPEGERPPIEDIPDEQVVFDVWVKDRRVRAAEFDFLQIQALDPDADIPAGATRLVLRAVFTPFDGAVQVPADAVELDVPALMQGMFMGMALGESMAGVTGPGAMPPGFDPSTMPPGFDPSMMPPGHPQPTPSG